MKKLLFLTIISTFIFSLVLAFNVSALDAKYETIKIGLYYGNSAKTSITVSSSGGFQAGYMNDSAFVNCYPFPYAELNVNYISSGGVSINGVAYDNPGAGNFSLMPVNGTININGTIYRGGVEFIPDSNAKLTVINFVNINDYIAAVVGKEMSPSWHIEALKAQAVCARSYAISSWTKHSSRGFNLCGTQDCQAYLGISGETESTKKAASETKNQVLMYDGKIASTLYSSSNGGSAGYAKNVWGTDVPYLRAMIDIYEKPEEAYYTPWQVTFTNSDIQEKLSSRGIDIGSVYDMKVTGADEYGRTYSVTIYGTKGTYELKNDSTRTFLGLRSQKYTITNSNALVGELYAVTSSQTKKVSSYTVISSGGKSTVQPDNIYVATKNGVIKASSGTSSIAPGTYVLDGAGWGHGLGMSQYGAKAMADQGFSYDKILAYYYKGTYLE